MANYKNAYYDIYTINRYFFENNKGQLTVPRKYESIHNYCHYRNNSGTDKCRDYFEMASSGVIHLLKNFKKYNLEDDKLAEYAILWLSYKLNQKSTKKMTDLNHFYTNYIETNNYYNNKINGKDGLTYKDVINKKKDLMNININEISKYNGSFHILFYLYYVYHDERLLCQEYSGLAKNFAYEFEKLNKDSKNIEDSPYSQILSTLSNDYKNLKKIYYDKNKSCNFPPLQELTPKKKSAENPAASSVDNPVDKFVKGSEQNSLEISGKGSGQILGQTLEVTSSSSSISTTLIPALSIVSIIPVFLGIAYKYSLFGVDKIFHRQCLRKKLKKIKKKMKLNI
ncbi:CIR protein PIR protein [Plasmodium vinckei lentum]|uniref:CIR protein PIR protein n=1 Tax=Plasmodium vinckei lentum TaxID=138297 RepID=A0A6V7RT12_PLAVN|nr:CIR protein PIR protein [Plasmodium vinckei lentum]